MWPSISSVVPFVTFLTYPVRRIVLIRVSMTPRHHNVDVRKLIYVVGVRIVPYIRKRYYYDQVFVVCSSTNLILIARQHENASSMNF